MYSSRTRVHIFKDSDSDSDAKDSDSDSDSTLEPSGLRLGLRQRIETVCLRRLSGHLVSIFSTPIIYMYMAGYCGTVSGSVKAIQYTCHKLTLNSLTVPASCSMQVEHVFSNGETFMWPHRTGLSNNNIKLEL